MTAKEWGWNHENLERITLKTTGAPAISGSCAHLGGFKYLCGCFSSESIIVFCWLRHVNIKTTKKNTSTHIWFRHWVALNSEGMTGYKPTPFLPLHDLHSLRVATHCTTASYMRSGRYPIHTGKTSAYLRVRLTRWRKVFFRLPAL